MPLSEPEVQAHAAAVLETSVTVLNDAVSLDLIDALAAAAAELLDETVSRCGATGNRGLHRYYETLPFEPPWADPALIDHDDVLAIVETLLGKDALLCQLGIDAPVLGSERQHLHRDAGFLFPETELETPPYLLAINIPLVDVTADTGPMEYAPGTQNLPDREAMQRIETGDIPLRPVLLRRGDVMIRDVRHIHCGTPNCTPAPRPMIVVGFSRPWMFRPDVSVRVAPAVIDGLSDRARRGLRSAIITTEPSSKEASVLPPRIQH